MLRLVLKVVIALTAAFVAVATFAMAYGLCGGRAYLPSYPAGIVAGAAVLLTWMCLLKKPRFSHGPPK